MLPLDSKTKTMFCKICFDAKKPEAEYTSHNIRMGEGRQRHVACPTLKNVRCHYCNGRGHTTSYCKKRNGGGRRDERRVKRQRMNPYAVLNELISAPKQNTVAPMPVTPLHSSWNSSFADIVKTSLAEAKQEIKDLKQEIKELKEKPVPAAPVKMSWADMMDEEDLEVLC